MDKGSQDHMGMPVGTVFVGRDRELELLASSIEQARTGQGPAAVCLEGEAGIGKTALLSHALSALSGVTVLRATCDPSESDMRFGLVGQLARRVPQALLKRYPVIDELVSSPGTVPPLTAVMVQLRLLVDELLEAGPVVVAVDDLQWADWASAQVARVALGQRRGEPLLVLAAVASTPSTATESGTVPWLMEGLGEVVRLPLQGLDLNSVAALATSNSTTPWSRHAVEELCSRTEGHPLFLQMVLADTEASQGAFNVPDSLLTIMRSRLSVLDVESRRLVDALAVLNSFVPPSTVGAVAQLADPSRAMQRTLQLGLVRWQGAGSPLIGMTHQLQREAVYAALTPTRRRELHLAAVSAVDEPAKWAHRVASAQQSDAETLSAQLEEAAWEQVTVGNAERAATWLLWAADLAGEQADRERRLLIAVIQLLSGRRMDRVQPLRETVQACAPSPLKDCVLGAMAGYQGAYSAARARLIAAMTAAADDPGLEWVAAEAGNLIAALSCWRGFGEVARCYAQEVLATNETAAHLSAPARSSMLIAHLLTDGPQAALARVNAGTEPWTREPGGQTVPASGYWHACMALAHIAAIQPMQSEQHARLSLTEGSPAAAEAWSGDLAYFCLSMGQYLRGMWDESTVSAAHCISISEGLEHPWACARAHAAASMIASGRGAFKQAAEHVEAAQQWVHRVGPQEFEIYPALARAILAQARSDHHAMAGALLPLRADSGGWVRVYRSWWLPLLAEGLAGTGAIHEAGAVVGELRQMAQHTPALSTVEAWLSGQLLEHHGEVDEAAATYAIGLTRPSPPPILPLHRARLEHAYAHLLALRDDVPTAITHLRRAHNLYSAMGAAPFESRCRDELVSLIRMSEK